MEIQKWRETRVVGERIDLDEYETRPGMGETEHHSHPMLVKLLTMANGNISHWLGPWVCHP